MAKLTKDGKIKAKTICPFLGRCSQQTSKCPKRGNTHEVNFSCGLARLFARSAPKMVEVVEDTVEVETFDILKAVELKKNQRFAGETWVNFSIGDKLFPRI